MDRDGAPPHSLPLVAVACMNAVGGAQRPLGTTVVGAVAPARIQNVAALFYGYKELLAAASDPAKAREIIVAKEQSNNRKIGRANRKHALPLLQVAVAGMTYEVGTTKRRDGLVAQLGASVCDAFGVPRTLRNGGNAVRRAVERVSGAPSVWDVDCVAVCRSPDAKRVCTVRHRLREAQVVNHHPATGC